MTEGYRKRYGNEGESQASSFITRNGFSIIEKNYRAGRTGEIDIIASLGNLVVFFEVKTRSSELFGGGIYSISEKKKRVLRKSAAHFLQNNSPYNSPEYNFRFDLLIVKNTGIEWIEDIVR